MTQAPCTNFEASNFTSSATKCKWCGSEEWQHKEFKKFSLLPKTSKPIATDYTTLNTSPSIQKMAEEIYPEKFENYTNGIPHGMYGMCDSNYYERQAFIEGYKSNTKLEEVEKWVKEEATRNNGAIYVFPLLDKINELKQ